MNSDSSPQKRRKSQRIPRIVYETTEHSVFEQIISESQAMAFAFKSEAKAQAVASAPDTEDRPQKGRKSQRVPRIVYETTEHSIFEHIISESRAIALAVKSGAKAQKVARAPDAEDGNAKLGGASWEKKRFRKKRANFEREMTLASDDIEARASGMELDVNLDEPEDALPLPMHEAASRLAAGEEPPTPAQTMQGDETQRHKVNFFNMSPASRVVSGLFETSAERSTLPRLEG